MKLRYLVTKHFHNQGYAVFGRVVNENDAIAEGWQGITAFVLEKDKALILAHHSVFAGDIELVDDSDVITST